MLAKMGKATKTTLLNNYDNKTVDKIINEAYAKKDVVSGRKANLRTLSALLVLVSCLFISLTSFAAGESSADSSESVGEDIVDTATEEAEKQGGLVDNVLSQTVKPNKPISTTPSLTEKNTAIETKPASVNDSDIKKRITGIFSEIDGLHNIQVTVNEGVVGLNGEVPNEKKAQQAVNLANRLNDVVAVEDSIDRTLDVQDNVTPVISGIRQQILDLIRAIPLLLVAMVVFAVVSLFGKWLSNRDSLWEGITPNPFVAELFSQTTRFIFIALGIILALSFMGAEAVIGTLLGGAGVIGIAVGFAVKDTIENYISSLLLSIRQPFRARDFVNINGQEGIVVRLTSRATILMTVDGNQLRIPNSEVFKATILNYTKNPERRFVFELGIDANDDPLAGIKVGLNAVKTLDFVLETPHAICIVSDVGDSNILLEFQVWVDQTETDFQKARSIAIREAKNALENNGFSLPEPIYRVRFNEDVENAIAKLKASGDMVEPAQASSRDASSGFDYAPKLSQSSTSRLNAENSKFTPAPERSPFTDSVSLEKARAKARAQHILCDADDVFDARPDPELMEKVEEEIKDNAGDKDLLDVNSPQE